MCPRLFSIFLREMTVYHFNGITVILPNGQEEHDSVKLIFAAMQKLQPRHPMTQSVGRCAVPPDDPVLGKLVETLEINTEQTEVLVEKPVPSVPLRLYRQPEKNRSAVLVSQSESVVQKKNEEVLEEIRDRLRKLEDNFSLENEKDQV